MMRLYWRRANPRRLAARIELATATWLQGEAALRLNEVVRAEQMIDRALALLGGKSPPSKLKGDLMLTRGGVHAATARVGEALADYHAAHDIFRDIGETRSQSIALAVDRRTLFRRGGLSRVR